MKYVEWEAADVDVGRRDLVAPTGHGLANSAPAVQRARSASVWLAGIAPAVWAVVASDGTVELAWEHSSSVAGQYKSSRRQALRVLRAPGWKERGQVAAVQVGDYSLPCSVGYRPLTTSLQASCHNSARL